MRQTLYKIFASLFPAVGWTLIIIILLCLPGGMFPQEETFTITNFDKYVHAGLFGGFVVLWCFYFAEKYPARLIPIIIPLSIFVLSCLLGIALEFVQKYWIPGRDYDTMDMVADSAGAALGLGLVYLERLHRMRVKNSNKHQS